LIANFWWPVLFPALAIASVVIAVNLFADGLTRVLER
jgi:ABC-type dipeptide/oligopeptide/nickel transport system permease subunit